MKKIVLLFLLFFTALYAEEYSVEEEYNLGEGIQIGSLPLYVGGYFSLDYRYKDEVSRYRVDDIALLAYGGYENLSYLAEFEFKEFYAYSVSDTNTSTQKDTSLHLERLYLDYSFNENYRLRAGKYNSPVGFWNLLPINVLRDTSSNPISTEIIFPKFTTGLEATYSSYNESELQIDFLAQYNDDLDPSYNNYEMDEHFGLGVSYIKDGLSLKLNIGMFDNYLTSTITEHLYYALASFKYETEDYQLMSEVGSQKSKNDFTTNYAGYIQGVYHFTEKHAAIVRVESYDDVVNGKQDDIAIFGYTYRPRYPIALKTEYQFHSLENENQFLFSFSVLF